MYKTPGYGRRLRFVHKCRLVAEYILPVILRTLFLSSMSMFRCCCCCCCSHREKERKNRQHIREIQNAHTNTHTDRQSVIKRANKKARFMLPSKTTTKAREHYFSTSFARPRQFLATSSAIRWRSLARTTVFYSQLLVLLLHRHQTMREEDFDGIPSSSSM